jgi:hypothetical protein
MWSSGPRGGAGGQNPVSFLPERVGEVAGEALGVTRNRFGCSLTSGAGPAAGRGGGRQRRSLEAVAPASCFSA